MAYTFLDTLTTAGVRQAQSENGSAELWRDLREDRASDRLTEAERSFVAKRDSFYMATNSESGWPYVQHRGGPPGFLKVIDDGTLAFADFRGNRQYISVGNLKTDDRAALILMDYPGRRRLKVLGHLEVREAASDPELAARLRSAGYRAHVERAIILRLTAFDWNCPQHITARFTEPEIRESLGPIHARLKDLEAENAGLRAQIAGSRGTG